MMTIEEKFDRKLADPFYASRITIKDGPFRKLRSKIHACANRMDDPARFRSDVYTRLFLILHHAESSSAITSIIATQRHIRDLASRSLGFLTYFSTLDCRRSITGMQNGRGMPTEQNIKDLRTWCTVEGKECDMELLRSITGMQAGRGMPTEENIKDLRTWCTVEGKTCDMELLRSITGMQHGKGMPTEENIQDLRKWCTVEGKTCDMELLRSITGMQNGRGMPTEQNIKDLRTWCTVEGKTCDMELLRSITGMQAGWGMPTEAMVKEQAQKRGSTSGAIL